MGSTVVTRLSGDGHLIREYEEETCAGYDFVVFEEQQIHPKVLGIVLKLSLLHTEWLLLHFIPSFCKYAFRQ